VSVAGRLQRQAQEYTCNLQAGAVRTLGGLLNVAGTVKCTHVPAARATHHYAAHAHVFSTAATGEHGGADKAQAAHEQISLLLQVTAGHDVVAPRL
jgi:hypothetical protein